MATLLDLPVVADWSALADVVRRAGKGRRPDWELPLDICQAAGGQSAEALPAAAAIACMQISIILVDDILDDDPRGEQVRLGDGRAANMAVALQGAAMTLLTQAAWPDEQRLRALHLLAQMAQDTAQGQELDVLAGEPGEEVYWQLVRAKSVPFYATAFELGGVAAGRSAEMLAGIREAGTILGEMVQVHDDMADAFQSPAGPDWLAPRHNLLLLYATLAEYDQKNDFMLLRERILDPAALEEAQTILIRCGAVSYAVHHLLVRYRRMRQLINSLGLPRPDIVQTMCDHQIRPVASILKFNNIPVPEELAHLL